MQTRSKFLNTGEHLLVLTDHGGDYGREWLGHPAKRYATAADVAADWNGDGVLEFRRVDEDWDVEDVTEEVATAFIEAYGDDLTPDAAVPLYVANSQAWADFCEGYSDSLPPVLTPRTHGTMNKAMQGLSQ